MLTRFLFPHRYKPLGWVLFGLGLLLGILSFHFEWQPRWLEFHLPPFIMPDLMLRKHNFLHEISGLLFIAGALLAACSREQTEDEFITRLRLESLLWAIYLNYALLVVALLFTYEFTFYAVMVYSMFTPLVLFLLRFHYVLYRTARAARYEE
jgi:hypothetical protein